MTATPATGPFAALPAAPARRSRRTVRLAARALLLLALWPAPSAKAVDEPAAEIEAARALLLQAESALRKAESGEARLAAIGRAVSAQEAALAALRRALRMLAREEHAIRTRIAAEEGSLSEVLSALQSMAGAPRSAILAYPGGPVEAARAAAMLADLRPVLEERTARLGARLERLAAIRADQQAAAAEAKSALAALQEMRARSDRALAQRRRPGGRGRAALDDAALAAARTASDLAALGAALAGVGRQGPRLGFETARGRLTLPVAGSVTARFGEPDPLGRPGTGWTVDAPAFAQVVAPWDGTVRFAGTLGRYGKVVVLEPETGYLMVMAGLGRLDREVGEVVLAGEKLGDMGGPLPSSEEFLFEAAADDDLIGREKLYLELRRDGEPVDPAEWFEQQES